MRKVQVTFSRFWSLFNMFEEETYKIHENGRQVYPIVLSAPHSGRSFPANFLAASPLSSESLLATADLRTDELADIAGTSAISSKFARSFVDLNRGRWQLDPAVIEGISATKDLQVQNGYGVLPRYANKGCLTMEGKITLIEAEERLSKYYDPYHRQLQFLLDQTVDEFGRALLIDVHSAPAQILREVDIVLGTCFGASLRSRTLAKIESAFQAHDFHIVKDIPFAGGYITQTYHQNHAVEVIQIEIRRDWLDEDHFPIFIEAWKQIIDRIVTEY